MRFLPLCLLLAIPPAFAAEGDEVKLSLPEFLKMYDATKAKKGEEKPEKPPRPYALSNARYVGEVEQHKGDPSSAVFRATFTVEVLGDGWTRIPLLDAQVAVERARVGGVDAPIVLENGAYTLVTERKGRFEVEVDFAVGVQSEGGSTNFAFQLQPFGATTMELSVPSERELDLRVANAKRTRSRSVDGMQIIEATLPSRGAMSVRWQRALQDDTSEKAEPRIYAEVQTLAGVGDGLVTATTTIEHTILFAGVDELKVKIPDGTTVLDVRGRGLRDWQLSDEGVLSAQLNFEALGSYSLALDLEQVVAGASVQAPLVEPIDVERSKGWVGVQARGAVEVKAPPIQGLAPVDVRTLPARIQGVDGTPVLLGYKYLGVAPELGLMVEEHDEVDVLVTLVDQAEATTMFTVDGRRLTSVTYQVRNNRRQFLRLALPDGATLWSASVAGRAVQPASSEDRLLLPLVRSAASGGALAAFTVQVVYVESGDGPSAGGTGHFEADLPVADAPTTYVAWRVFAPKEAKVKKKSVDGSLRDVDFLSRPVAAAEALEIREQTQNVQRAARQEAARGGLGNGAAPVKVQLPLDGTAYAFEKVLALEERLWVAFDYKGLKP